MPDLTPTQLENASLPATRPIYLVCLEHAGVEELLSSSGDVVFDGQNYLAGGITVSGISNTRSATLTLPWSTTRMTEIQNGSYRGGKCKIWYIPAVPSDTDLIFDAEDGVLIMDGEIRSSRFSGDSVTIAVTHINNGNVFTPRNTLKQVTNYALPPGTLITWEGETRQLESRRFGGFDQAYGALGRGSVANGRSSLIDARGRLPASTLRDIATPPRDQTLTVAGSDAPIPIVYGRRSIPGLVTLRGTISGDLVLGVVWCLGEIEEIEDVYINGEAVPVGVTQTDYLGTTSQTTDSTLSTAIAAFSDAMILETPNGNRGIAYSVFRIPTGELDGSPTFQAVVKGMKVYDPRTPATAYSDNTALCMADLASSPIYGLGANVQGLTDAADWCDELIDTFKRCRLALDITQVRRTEEYLDLMATYAECLWYNEGADIKLVPDKIIGVDNPSGLDLLTDFSDWDLQDGWSESAGTLTVDGTQTGTTLARSVEFSADADAVYAVEVTVSSITASELLLQMENETESRVPLTDDITTAGTYSSLYTARAGDNLLRIRALEDTVASITSVKMRRLYYLEENCVKGSLDVEGVDDGDTPTKVFVRYTSTAGTGGVWSDALASVALPGVESGDTRLVETTLSMPGIYRVTEAASKANARLQRMRNRVRVTWVTTDKGIRHRIGDVIQHRMPYRGTDILVKLTSVDLIGYGRYRVSGLRYDEAHYPDEIPLPEDVGTVPVGAIVPLSGDTVPSGWAAYTDADGKYIVGAGDTYDVEDTGGSLTASGWSSTTDSRDMHANGGGFSRFEIVQGSGVVNAGVGIYSDNSPNTTHSHSFSIGTLTPNLPRRENRLIIKTGSASTEFPAAAQVFGLPNLLLAGLTRVVTSANRLLVAETANANAGVATLSLSGTTGSAGVNHDHRTVSAVRDDDLGPSAMIYSYVTAVGAHTHSYSLTLNRNVKRRALALYGSDGDFAVIPGMIVLWSGSLGSLPTDWVLCDGAGGTPDMQDYFIEIAPEGGEGVASGDNTLTVNGNTSSHAHNHRGSGSLQGLRTFAALHSDNGTHNHNITRTRDWMPPYYALAAIMYSP